jgi:Ca2+-transporting ATPase
MITLHRTPEGERLAVMKGGPSTVLAVCDIDEQMRTDFARINEEMADQALRVLALAEKSIPGGEADHVAAMRAATGYRFLGFVGMSDPPRPEVSGAIEKAHAAGIRVVMLTGDQINTARAIARELRLNGDQEPRAIHARDLEGADHRKIAELARSVDVFARVSPEDKLKIVAALQGQDEILAVTGDGVNDAPALKRADIGVAMGMRGTEVAKEAADVVLADDNFATIIKAVEGGRTIYANIHKFVHLMFSTNLAEVLVIFSALVIGWPLPLTPLQILWVNLVTDVFPAMALAVEPSSPDAMRRPPTSPQAALLSNRFFTLILWQSAMLAGITLVFYGWALGQYGEGAHARTIALLALVGVQLGHTFNCRSQTRSALEGLNRNPALWIASAIVIALQLTAIYFRPLGAVLDTAPINASDWMIAGISIITPIVIVEATKWFSRRRKASGK